MIYLPSKLIHINEDKPLQTRDAQEITQGLNQNKGIFIKNWLSTVPLSLDYLVDQLLQITLENMPSDSCISLQSGQISTENTKLAKDIRDS